MIKYYVDKETGYVYEFTSEEYLGEYQDKTYSNTMIDDVFQTDKILEDEK